MQIRRSITVFSVIYYNIVSYYSSVSHIPEEKYVCYINADFFFCVPYDSVLYYSLMSFLIPFHKFDYKFFGYYRYGVTCRLLCFIVKSNSLCLGCIVIRILLQSPLATIFVWGWILVLPTTQNPKPRVKLKFSLNFQPSIVWKMKKHEKIFP